MIAILRVFSFACIPDHLGEIYVDKRDERKERNYIVVLACIATRGCFWNGVPFMVFIPERFRQLWPWF